MPSKLTIFGGESNLLRPLNYIRFWERGEMAYSALKRINDLKAKNEYEKAKIMQDDWIFQELKGQEIISKIAYNEKLSQSKVEGILVEEGLIAKGLLDLSTTNDLIRKNLYRMRNNTYDLYYKYNNLDELISDKGITYNTKYIC